MENQITSGVSALPGIEREQKIIELVRTIRAGNEELFPELWDCIERLCAWYCRRLYKQLPKSFFLEYDDLLDCGFLALHDAVQHFDLERGGNFSYFYLFYLTGAIYRENGLTKGGHNPDGSRRFDPLIDRGTVRIDAQADDSGEKPGTLAEVLSSDAVEHAALDSVAAADERIFFAQLHDALESLISKLPAQEQFIIRQRFYIEKTRKRIAQELCISMDAARTLEDHALVNLRNFGRSEGLGQYLDSRTNFYSGTGLSSFREKRSSSTELLAIKRLDLEAKYYNLKLTENRIASDSRDSTP